MSSKNEGFQRLTIGDVQSESGMSLRFVNPLSKNRAIRRNMLIILSQLSAVHCRHIKVARIGENEPTTHAAPLHTHLAGAVFMP